MALRSRTEQKETNALHCHLAPLNLGEGREPKFDCGEGDEREPGEQYPIRNR
jgi:hypothetical protein